LKARTIQGFETEPPALPAKSPMQPDAGGNRIPVVEEAELRFRGKRLLPEIDKLLMSLIYNPAGMLCVG
jgi:hypothetical protein